MSVINFFVLLNVPGCDGISSPAFLMLESQTVCDGGKLSVFVLDFWKLQGRLHNNFGVVVDSFGLVIKLQHPLGIFLNLELLLGVHLGIVQRFQKFPERSSGRIVLLVIGQDFCLKLSA